MIHNRSDYSNAIGKTERGTNDGTPMISASIVTGSNLVIVGGVIPGCNGSIAPISFVNLDVPDYSVVSGNPGKNGSEIWGSEYIKRPWGSGIKDQSNA